MAIDEEFPKARPARLLKYFSELGDVRVAWRVAYTIHEVLLLAPSHASPSTSFEAIGQRMASKAAAKSPAGPSLPPQRASDSLIVNPDSLPRPKRMPGPRPLGFFGGLSYSPLILDMTVRNTLFE